MGNRKRFETQRMLWASSITVLVGLACQEVPESSITDQGERGGAPTVGGRGPVLDERPVVQAEQAPPPVTGGTLLALSDGRRVLASDPDRDRIWLIDYVHSQFDVPIELERGALPGRAVEDNAGNAHVVLRGSGDVLSIDLTTASVSERRHVCVAPRGIALGPSGDKLLVACSEGLLVELPFSGDARSETAIPRDARDVVVQKGHVLVSRFRASELVELDANRNVAATMRLPNVSGVFNGTSLAPITLPGVDSPAPARFEPAVAWRTVVGPNGNSVVMVHQRATTSDIVLPPHTDGDHPIDDLGTAGAGSSAVPGGGSAYGGDASGCGGIVQSAITIIQDGVAVTSPQIAGVVLPVDVAVSNDGFIALASAGTADISNARGFAASMGNGLVVLTAADIDRTLNGDCAQIAIPNQFSQPMVGVAFEPGENGRLLALSRQPLALFVVNNFRQGGVPAVESTIQLPARSSEDTGHEIFHRDSGGGLACASCHPEGTDDGRTWNFSPTGPRRTQPIDVGLDGTAPFHWDGDLPTIDSLMGEVFVRRMGGTAESPERTKAVQDWVFSLAPRAPIRAANEPAVKRGSALFNSSEVGCSACHAGAKFTNNVSFDVGTGGNFQVPSLLGVGQRAPLMHNGCALTLRDRFDPNCGGAAHGNTSQLDEGQLSDLIAYLESI
jgi:hypothetical protein